MEKSFVKDFNSKPMVYFRALTDNLSPDNLLFSFTCYLFSIWIVYDLTSQVVYFLAETNSFWQVRRVQLENH